MRMALAAGLLVWSLNASAQQPGTFDWGAIIGPEVEGPLIGYYTGEKLYRRGRDAVTVGYVVGVHDATWATKQLTPFCVPDGVLSGQLTDVAWKFLEQNPELRHHSASYLVRRAFAKAWPCPPK